MTDNIVDIVEQIRQRLHDEQADRYTTDEIVSMINNIIRDIAFKALYFKKETELQFNSKGELELPEDTIKLYYIFIADKYIEIATRVDLVTRGLYKTIVEGLPEYAIVGYNNDKIIKFHPKPNADIIAKPAIAVYAYLPQQVDIAGEIDATTTNAIIFGTCAELLLSDKDTQSLNTFNIFNSKYINELRELKRAAKKMFSIDTSGIYAYKHITNR